MPTATEIAKSRIKVIEGDAATVHLSFAVAVWSAKEAQSTQKLLFRTLPLSVMTMVALLRTYHQSEYAAVYRYSESELFFMKNGILHSNLFSRALPRRYGFSKDEIP
jgi:hypothetical protein